MIDKVPIEQTTEQLFSDLALIFKSETEISDAKEGRSVCLQKFPSTELSEVIRLAAPYLEKVHPWVRNYLLEDLLIVPTRYRDERLLSSLVILYRNGPRSPNAHR